jgi:deazaflavin-dependent oxidoreductase (nitroreductase family)
MTATEPEHRPAAWQRLMQRLAWSAPGIFVFSRTLHFIDRPLLRLSKGRLSVPALLTGLPVISLTTTGAKTGAPRAQPLVALRDGERFVVIASSWGRRRHPSWYHNLRAHPEATITVDGRAAAYAARDADDDERARYWQRAVELYPGYRAYERRAGRRIPVVVLEPKG